MPRSEDDILASELSKLGALAGAIGGGVGAGASGALGAAAGGALGAAFAARLLPNDTFEVTTEIKAAPDTVVRAVFHLLRQEGNIVESDEAASAWPTLCAVVGSGFLNLNPALVRIQIEPLSANLTGVSIRGTAKEGLIKQRSGEKAARRITDLLTQSFL